ncbi:MAG: HAD family hydrolase [Verrucomicrobia bacterium]|nr:HAD family hydrolase [Verrucomicrobiota bacterium]
MTAAAFQGLIFDMDGTLTRPCLDFDAMRRDLNLPPGDIVQQIEALPSDSRDAAWAVLEAHEDRAMQAQELQTGTEALLGRCHQLGIRLGLITRNARRRAEHLCDRFGLTFDILLGREFDPMKPDPAPALHMLDAWQLPATAVLMIGDYIHDLHCGRDAGIATCFFHNPGFRSFADEADHAVTSMDELSALIFQA